MSKFYSQKAAGRDVDKMETTVVESRIEPKNRYLKLTWMIGSVDFSLMPLSTHYTTQAHNTQAGPFRDNILIEQARE